MKTCVLSESPADEEAIGILVGGILGRPITPVAGPALRSRGWAATVNILPSVLKYLHYQTDAEAFVAVIDSDESPVHEPAHEAPGGAVDKCRLCVLRALVADSCRQLRPLAGRANLRIALGLAVPAVEAWYRFRLDPAVSEAAWLVGLGRKGKFPYTKAQLKVAVYGTDRPSLERETECATREAERLAQDLGQLEKFFPNGFGPLYREIRSW
jgi:hypothetical protein